jgi:hypothetical protein
LRCHAIKKNGEQCTNSSCSYVGGHPVCGVPTHYDGAATLRPVTADSLSPLPFEKAKAWIAFMEGMSFEEIATRNGWTVHEVELFIREMGRR